MKGNIGALGVDVSDRSIEIAQVQVGNAKESTIYGYGRAALPAGTIQEGRLLKPQPFTEALRAILSKPQFGRLEGRQIVFSIPEHQCYHHSLVLDSVGDARSPFTIVQEKLQTVMPMPLQELAWDWTILRQQGRRSYVYVLAVSRDVLQAYQSAFQSVGLTMRIAEPQVVSAGRDLWGRQFVDEPLLFMDIGSRETSVATVDDLGIHQSSVIDAGADLVIEDLMKELKLDKPTATKILATIGLRNLKHPQVNVVHDIVRRYVRQIFEEGQQHLIYYQAQHHLQTSLIKRLAIIGGGALIPGVPELMASSLKLQLVSPGSASRYKPALSAGDAALYANALGAARRPLEAAMPDVNVLATRRIQQTEANNGLGKWWRTLFRREKG